MSNTHNQLIVKLIFNCFKIVASSFRLPSFVPDIPDLFMKKVWLDPIYQWNIRAIWWSTISFTRRVKVAKVE